MVAVLTTSSGPTEGDVESSRLWHTSKATTSTEISYARRDMYVTNQPPINVQYHFEDLH